MVHIRRAEFSDLQRLQHANLQCLPENYSLKYYLYHALCWPQLLYLAEDVDSRGQPVVVGYVLAKLDEDSKIPQGHITSLAVLRSHRQLGLATKLMEAAHQAMRLVFKARYCSLHVRQTNIAAKHLYTRTLAYEDHGLEERYYADGEHAFYMRKTLVPEDQVAEDAADDEAQQPAPPGGPPGSKKDRAGAAAAALKRRLAEQQRQKDSGGGASAGLEPRQFKYLSPVLLAKFNLLREPDELAAGAAAAPTDFRTLPGSLSYVPLLTELAARHHNDRSKLALPYAAKAKDAKNIVEAASLGNLAKVQFFLEKADCDVNMRYGQLRRTAAMMAVQAGDDLGLLRLLREHKADLMLADARGLTALHLAAIYDRPAAASYLLEELELPYSVRGLRDAYGLGPLAYAVAFGRLRTEAVFQRRAAELGRRQQESQVAEDDAPEEAKDSRDDAAPSMSGVERLKVQLLLDAQAQAESSQKPQRSLDALLKHCWDPIACFRLLDGETPVPMTQMSLFFDSPEQQTEFIAGFHEARDDMKRDKKKK